MERGKKRGGVGGGSIISSFWLQQANNILGQRGGFPKQPIYSTMPYNSPRQQGNGEEGEFLDSFGLQTMIQHFWEGEGEERKFPK